MHTLKIRHLLFWALFACLALSVLSCESGQRMWNAEQSGRLQYAPVPLAGVHGNLPQLSELASRTAQFTEGGLVRSGSELEAALPNQRVAQLGSSLDFQALDPATTRNLAFAVYGFNVENYNRETELHLDWLNAPQSGNLYLVLANFARSQWEWFSLSDAALLSLPSFSGYSTASQPPTLYCAVVCASPALLASIRIGAEPLNPGPSALLTASPPGGTSPLLVSFSAANSTAGLPTAELVHFEWDFGDGATASGTDTEVQHSYSASGVFEAKLTVTDDLGAQDTATLLVGVDHPAPTASLLASTSSGDAPLTVSFDASGSSAVLPATLTDFAFDFDDGNGFVSFGLSANPQFQFNAPGLYGVQLRVTDSFGGQSTNGLQIQVDNPGGPGDNYDEVEPNDAAFMANLLPDLPFEGYRGNVGLGGAYDGDQIDIFRFLADAGTKLQLRLEHGATLSSNLELYDANLSFLAAAGPGSGPHVLNYTIQPGDSEPFFVFVLANSGEADYELSVGLNPVSAQLSVDDNNAAPGATILLDASGSLATPPATIVSFEFDPLGDGSFSAPQASAQFMHQYADPAVYFPVVRVKDSAGNVDTASTLVLIGTIYSETEPNNSVDEMNPLPALPFTSWLGSHGSGSGYDAYDGSNEDWYSFTAAPGQQIRIKLDWDNSTGGMSLDLFSAGGILLGFTDDTDGQIVFLHLVDAGESPFQLKIWDGAVQHFGDYTLQITIL